IWMRELASGKESMLVGSNFVQRYPLPNGTGDRVAFSVYERGKRAIYLSAPGGIPEKLCEGCLRPTDWSRDGKAIVTHGGAPFQISLLDVSSHQQTTLLKHPIYNLIYGRLSPDNRWISFTVRVAPNRGLITIASLDGAKPIAESAWVTIAEA